MDTVEPRRFLKRSAAGAFVCAMLGAQIALAASEARAQDYPTRTVTIIVPFPPGTSPTGSPACSGISSRIVWANLSSWRTDRERAV